MKRTLGTFAALNDVGEKPKKTVRSEGGMFSSLEGAFPDIKTACFKFFGCCSVLKVLRVFV